jgi:hypothetical protein
MDSGDLPSTYCTRQSLCRVQHSAKTLRQKIRRQRNLCQVSFIGLPSAISALGKEKWPSRRRSVSACFAKCHVRGTWQRFFLFFLKKSLPSAISGGTRQRFFFYFYNFFAECPQTGHSAKIFKKNS